MFYFLLLFIKTVNSYTTLGLVMSSWQYMLRSCQQVQYVRNTLLYHMRWISSCRLITCNISARSRAGHTQFVFIFV